MLTSTQAHVAAGLCAHRQVYALAGLWRGSVDSIASDAVLGQSALITARSGSAARQLVSLKRCMEACSDLRDRVRCCAGRPTRNMTCNAVHVNNIHQSIRRAALSLPACYWAEQLQFSVLVHFCASALCRPLLCSHHSEQCRFCWQGCHGCWCRVWHPFTVCSSGR